MSSIEAGRVVAKVEPDASGFGKAVGDQISKQQSAITRKMGRYGLALGGAVAFGIHKAIQTSVDLQETFTAVTYAFGTSADRILEAGKSTQDAFSQIEFNRAAKGFATFGKAAKLTDDETADFSLTLIGAAQDLASFHDANTSDALQDMQSALTGLYRPLRKYAIVLSDAGLQTYALNKGIIQQGQKLTDQEKIVVRQQYILENMGAATGDWARTMGNAANQERLLKANATDLSAQLGNALLPAYTKVLGVAVRLVAFMGKHTTAVKIAVVAIAALAAGMLIYTAVMKAAAAATVIMAIATRDLSKATKANIIGALAVAVLFLVTTLITAYQTSSKFRHAIQTTLEYISKGIGIFIKWVALLAYVWSRAIVVILRGAGYLPKVGDKFDAAADKIEAMIGGINHLGDKMMHVKPHLDALGKSAANTGGNLGKAAIDTDSFSASMQKLQEKLTSLGDSGADISSVFSTKVLQAFDAETARVLNNLTVRVSALGRSWLMRPGDQTPAERELEALDAIEAKKALIERRAEARKAIREAKGAPDVEQEIGSKIITIQTGADKEALKKAQEELAQVDKDAHRQRLTDRAKSEREAATDAIANAQKEYQALRDLQKEHFEKELGALDNQVAKGLIKQGEYRRKTLALLSKYGVSLEEAGRDLGTAFSTGLLESMAAVQKQAKTTYSLLQRILNLKKKIDIANAKNAKMKLDAAAAASKGKGTTTGAGVGVGQNGIYIDKWGVPHQIVGQQVQNQYVTDDSTARQIGNSAAKKATRQVRK